jgi:hypothetical protein
VTIATVIAGAIAGSMLVATIERAAAVPPAATFEPLAELNAKTEAARRMKTNEGRKYESLIRDAIDAKHEFMELAFGQQTLFGCNVNRLFRAMDDVDVPASAAFSPNQPKRPRLEAADQAIQASRALKGLIAHCPQATRKVKKLTRQIVDNLEAAKQKIEDGDKPSEFLNRVHDLKRDMLRGTVVYGCNAERFYDAIARIDVTLYAAAFEEHQSQSNREHFLKVALENIHSLDRQWTEVPCGGTTVPPPETPACSDGAGSDFPANPACLSAQDTTDQSHAWTYHYPGEGFTGTDYIDFKAEFKDGEAITANAYRVFFNPSVHETTTVNHGATPITGTMPCDGLSGTTIRAGIGGQAPTGGVLPATPGEDHMRIVIDTSDPVGGTNCGTGTVTLQVAADTR